MVNPSHVLLRKIPTRVTLTYALLSMNAKVPEVCILSYISLRFTIIVNLMIFKITKTVHAVQNNSHLNVYLHTKPKISVNIQAIFDKSIYSELGC